MPLDLTIPERTATTCRAAMRFCARNRWAPLAEMPIPCGRRLDIMALTPEGCLFAIEVKSGPRDFLTDNKWHEYRDWCDRLYFAVDVDFPQELIPEEIGLIVSDGFDAVMVRDTEHKPLAGARRKSLMHRYAVLSAGRLAALCDPVGAQEMRAALLCE
jgi:hypothetical protein